MIYTHVIFNPVLICPLTISNRREESRLPSVEVNQVVPSDFNASAPTYSVPPPSSTIPPAVGPIQYSGDSAATPGASILLTTEPPSYIDAIKKY